MRVDTAAGEVSAKSAPIAGWKRLVVKPAVPISASEVDTLIADGDGLLVLGARFGIMFRLVLLLLTEPADNLTKSPNNSHKLRPNFEEQLNSGRKSLL